MTTVPSGRLATLTLAISFRGLGASVPPSVGGPQPANEILMSPDGRYVLINADYNVYRAAMPFVGEQLTISVTRPESERFPIEKLNTLGTHFMNWGPNGDEVTWSLGKTVFRYNIDEAEKRIVSYTKKAASMFMFKDFSSRGELTINHTPLSYFDFPSIVMGLSS